MSLRYADLMESVADSRARLEADLARLTDALAREASPLPGWSRGHVVTHLARNAEALGRLAVGVLTGVPGPMYPGGADARNAAISEGADRPAGLLRADLHFAGSRLIECLQSITDDLLNTAVTWRKPIVARDLALLRWRELEIHHLDLAIGYTPQDWPSEFVESTLQAELPVLQTIRPDVTVPDLPRAELLAWLVGRGTRAGVPEVPAWPF